MSLCICLSKRWSKQLSFWKFVCLSVQMRACFSVSICGKVYQKSCLSETHSSTRLSESLDVCLSESIMYICWSVLLKCLYICLSECLLVWLKVSIFCLRVSFSVCLKGCLSFTQFVWTATCLSERLSDGLRKLGLAILSSIQSVWTSTCLSKCLYVYLSVCMKVYDNVCLSVCLKAFCLSICIFKIFSF